MAAVTYTAQRGLKLLGDEKGAWLADTTAETITGSELVTNGDFSTDVSGWNGAFGGTITYGANNADVAGDGVTPFSGTISDSVTTVIGESYVLSIEVIAITGTWIVGKTDASNGAHVNLAYIGGITAAGTYHITFVATATSTYFIWQTSSVGSYTSTIDNASIRLADPDLSTKNNGLLVYGSITKNAVATGSELVAYSGFSASNYLEQPYNADLDFGAGDFCFIGWASPSAAAFGVLLELGTTVSTGPRIYLDTDSYVYAKLSVGISSPISIREYSLITYCRSSGVVYLYVNGTLVASAADTAVIPTASSLDIGARVDTHVNPFTGSLSLWRALDYAPTAAQIKAIYESEKHLFSKHSTYTQVGESYSLDMPIQSANPSTSTAKTDNVSLGGVTETIVDRDDDELDITTGLLHRTDTTYTRVSEFKEFMYGTRASESFTLDLYGSVASENEPETYIRVGQHSGPTPESNMHNWFRGSFKARKL